MSEREIIEALNKDKQKAKSLIYNEYGSMLFSVCMRYSNSREEAEDVFQDGLIQIFAKIDQYAQKGSLGGWLRRVMVNTTLMHHRDNRKMILVFDDDVPDRSLQEEDDRLSNESDEERISNAGFSKEELIEIIQGLPDGYRSVFNLYVFEEMKHKEIAELLNISESTSKSQLLRGRKLLKKRLLILSEQKENKEKSKKVLAIIPLAMSGKSHFIDGFMKEGLKNYKPSPPAGGLSGTGSGGESGVSGSGASGSTVTQQVITHSASKWYTVVFHQINSFFSVALVSAISLGVFTQSSEPHRALANSTEVVISEEPATSQSPIETNTLNKPYKTILNSGEGIPENPKDKETIIINTVEVKVPVKKVVHTRKKIIKRDTVRIVRKRKP